MPQGKKNDQIDRMIEAMNPASGGRPPIPFFGFDTLNPNPRQNAFPKFPQPKTPEPQGRSPSAAAIPRADLPDFVGELLG